MSAPLLLIADDDETIRTALANELVAAGYRTVLAATGQEALTEFDATMPDLVLTDLAMPGGDGFTVITGVRRKHQTPIIVISVRGGESDKVRALDLGADDYVVKPFSLPELLARVRTQLRRVSSDQAQLVFQELTIDVARRQVTQGGRDIHLTPTEFAVLELLARHAGKPVATRHLAQRIWGPSGASPDTVRVHVGALRRKLEPDPSNPRYVITEPWVGYRFIAEPID